jgi:hypothetical protein
MLPSEARSVVDDRHRAKLRAQLAGLIAQWDVAVADCDARGWVRRFNLWRRIERVQDQLANCIFTTPALRQKVRGPGQSPGLDGSDGAA